jgi:hypothetical protein
LNAACSSRNAPHGRQHERDTSDNCSDGAFVALGRTLQQRLNGLAAFGPDEAVNLADDFAAHRLCPEEHARDRDRDDENRRDRKQGIEGD